MGPILTVALIIAGFSLYDYYTTKKWQLITSSERNDAVFEKRNKEYGAYQIRRDYNKRILLILFFVCAGIGGLWGMKLAFGKTTAIKDAEKITKQWLIDIFDNQPIEELPELPQPKQETAVQQLSRTIEFRVPIVSDNHVDIPIKELVDPNIAVGVTTQDGNGKDVFDPTSISSGNGNGNQTIETNTDIIHTIIDENAIFPGGLGALRKYIAENIDLSSVDGSSIINLRFVVDTDGNISTVEVIRNTENCKSCEKAAIKVVKSMPKWTPGKINGKPVKSYYRLPINIQ
jgi:protein TonB